MVIGMSPAGVKELFRGRRIGETSTLADPVP